jgi:hypothetical protein
MCSWTKLEENPTHSVQSQHLLDVFGHVTYCSLLLYYHKKPVKILQ